MLKRLASLFVASILVSACGHGIEGSYTDGSGGQYSFQSGGKVDVTDSGMQTEMDYEVDGDKAKIKGPGGTLLLHRNDDGSLDSGQMLRLVKVKNK